MLAASGLPDAGDWNISSSNSRFKLSNPNFGMLENLGESAAVDLIGGLESF